MSETEYEVLLVLVGLPGSGKSTFADALVAHSITNGAQDVNLRVESSEGPRKRRWVRASQDEAPGRRRQECEAIVRRGLADGHNVIVDRVGFDRVQRSHFVQIARLHTPTPPQIWCLVLSVSTPALERRLLARPDHPTIKDPETAIRVLREMTRSMDPPRPGGGEGFDKIWVMPEEMQSPGGVWSALEVVDILRRIELQGRGDEGRYVPVEPRGQNQTSNGRGGYRGRGGYGGPPRGRGGFYGQPRPPFGPNPDQAQPGWTGGQSARPQYPYPQPGYGYGYQRPAPYGQQFNGQASGPYAPPGPSEKRRWDAGPRLASGDSSFNGAQP